jgi:SpoVK/Ycf46/Vps4 family AAA+-type ATPase
MITPEEGRAERVLLEAAASARYGLALWDCAGGMQGADGEVLDASLADPRAMLRQIASATDRMVYVLRDLHRWLDPVVLRTLRSLARKLQTEAPARSIIVLSPSSEIPPELAAHAVVISFLLPDRAEIGEILDRLVEALPDEVRGTVVNGERERAIDAAVGLTAEEAANCYARSLVVSKRIDPALVSAEKKRVIARERVLTWYDPDPRGLDAVGGLDGLKAWLGQRRLAFSQAARAYGLPAPKGVLLVGPPGCGKSLTAKAVATAWGVPLLRLDLGALRSKYVGESEGNIRKALAVAETVAPAVLWVDEIEKALAGSTGTQGDGGVSADALGAVLSWMQDRAGSVFVVATANDVSALPPELLRKGRFDELFFIDLPTRAERTAILAAALRQHGREPLPETLALSTLLDRMEGWSGAEITATVPEALFASFADGARALDVGDLVAASVTTVPLSESARDKIASVREWAKGRARPASLRDDERQPKRRAIDLA